MDKNKLIMLERSGPYRLSSYVWTIWLLIMTECLRANRSGRSSNDDPNRKEGTDELNPKVESATI